MRRFAQLYQELDSTTKTNVKVEALARYFGEAPDEDAAWALSFLIGRRPKNLLKHAVLVRAALEESGLPEWLFAECYHAVADSAETIALVLPLNEESGEDRGLAWWVEHRVSGMRGRADEEQAELLKRSWAELSTPERFVFNKLVTGAFRVGVSRELVLRGLAQAKAVPASVLAHRLMGDWSPSAEFMTALSEESETPISQPYPFALAHPLEKLEDLGDPAEWSAEWKWDGIRAQLIRRQGQTFLWSRGEDLIHESFPDVLEGGEALPDGTVLDGEIMPWRDGALSFNDLQRRLNRKAPSKKLIEEVPAVLIAFDLMELDGRDLREEPFAQRRRLLEEVLPAHPSLEISKRLPFVQLEELDVWRDRSREVRSEGLMLKRLDSPYPVGRRRGLWWKWKVQPFSVDAVLVYAQRGNGKRASLYTDYTFALWKDGELVPFAKAYSGLSDAEIREVDAFVRRHTKEKFGPVRTVDPELVFEIAFEGIQLSKRHKSGIAVRFPRIARWRKDKLPTDADQIEAVHALLRIREGGE